MLGLLKACAALVQHFDIFRTVFLLAAEKFYQVVLDSLDVPIEVVETEEDIATAIRALDHVNLQQPLRLGQSMLRISILKKRESTVRVVLRMSHALYDGLSFENIVHSLHSLYNGDRLPEPTKFARYIQHMVSSRKEGYDYWRSVLQHSSMTVIKDSEKSDQQQVQSDSTWMVEKVIKADHLPNVDGITQATVFATACALLLAKKTSSSDILCGRIVSGRQCLLIGFQQIVGPCTNIVPLRVCADEDADQRVLLRRVQDQYLSSLPFETLGFDETKDHCTDWPETITNYGCGITYQNFNLEPESQIQDQRIRLEALSADAQALESEGRNGILSREISEEVPIHDVDLVAVPEPDGRLRVGRMAKRRIWDEAAIEHNLSELCESILALTSALQNTSTGDSAITKHDIVVLDKCITGYPPFDFEHTIHYHPPPGQTSSLSVSKTPPLSYARTHKSPARASSRPKPSTRSH